MKKIRMWQWALVAVFTTAIIYFTAPEQLGLLLLKTCYIATAIVVGYYADRVIFYYERPHQAKSDLWKEVLNKELEDNNTDLKLTIIYAVAMVRRAIIVGSVVMAFALAL